MTSAELSTFVLKRFFLRCALLTPWAAYQAALGAGFVRPLAAMALLSAIVVLLIGILRHERVQASHWTSFDEATWFLLIGGALRKLAS